MGKFHKAKKGEVMNFFCPNCQTITEQKCVNVPQQYQSMIGPRTSFGDYKCLTCGREYSWEVGGQDR